MEVPGLFRLNDLDLRFEHSHDENDWHDMFEVPPSHAAVERDPERSWSLGKIFRCGACEDEIRVSLPDEDNPIIR
jgi:hypothetical protein